MNHDWVNEGAWFVCWRCKAPAPAPHAAAQDAGPCPGLTRVAKQVIVMRKDLNMRKGKMIAQGAHASLGVYKLIITDHFAAAPVYDHEAFRTWDDGIFTKICVSVDSVHALLEVHAAAHNAGLPIKMIIDSGLTEFGGVPTYTCLAIGPAWADEIDKIAGDLPLL